MTSCSRCSSDSDADSISWHEEPNGHTLATGEVVCDFCHEEQIRREVRADTAYHASKGG